MTAITKFDKQVCKHLTPEIITALEAVCKQYGLTVTHKGGTFSDTTFIAKVELAVTETEDGLTREQAEFNNLCKQWYCQPEDYGKTLLINGKPETLIGFAPTRDKFSVRTRNASGKVMLWQPSVLQQIGRYAPWEQPKEGRV